MMYKQRYNAAGLFTLVCVLTMLSVMFYQTNREGTFAASFLLKNIPLPKSENGSLGLSEEETGVAFLSEEVILGGSKNIDVMQVSMGNSSKLLITERREYSLGEEITVKIILHNVRGEKILRGGDYLRLWMENVKVKAAVSGKVMDNNDGTYSGILRAMWSGEAEIGVMILVRLEEIALIYQLYNKYHTVWYNYGAFSNGVTTEASNCSVAPYDNKLKWCNLTADNAGFSWFCVKPKKSGLSCDMWTRTWSINEPRRIGKSTVLQNMWTLSEARDLLPRTSLGIRGIADRVTAPATSCSKVEPEVTWNRKSPQGFFYKDQWHSTLCTDTMKHTPAVYKECLRGRTLYLHGDSTSGQFIDHLTNVLNLKKRGKGHNPKIRSDTEYNFTLSWYAHELPFYHGKVHYHQSVNLAQHIVLDNIKSNSRDIIILYIYVHFTLNHPDVFKVHIQRLVQSVRKLIARAPGVTVAFRGPHAFTKMSKYKLLHSYWGLHYMAILHEEFASLQKNVFYLDYWDMTMARIPTDMHPKKEIVTEMVHYMMSIVCNRK